MREIRRVLRLVYDQKMSHRSVSKSIGLSRDAVADYCTRAASAGLSWPLPDGLEDADLEEQLFPVKIKQKVKKRRQVDWAQIHQELKRKGATLRVLHEEYLGDHPDGLSYSQFCHWYREFAGGLKRYMRQTPVAGERVQVDYAGPTMPVTTIATGEIRYAQIFVAVLGCSNYAYAEAHWSQGLPNWIAAHVRLFEFLGGVPEAVVCDNLKSGVTKASRTEPVINRTYQGMADHYDTMIVPARPRRPKDKPKVENSVLIIERWILFRLRNRLFTSLHELNEAIAVLLIDLNNRPFQKLPGSRQSTFESLDKPALRPLPDRPYEYAEFHRARVGMDYHITLDGCPYSVPAALCRKEVDVRVTTSTIEILYGGRRVASHAKGLDGKAVTNPDHMTSEHRHYASWNESNQLVWAREMGEHIHTLLKELLEVSRVKEQRYRHSTTMKKLVADYGAERVDAACHQAIDIQAKSLSHVRSILRMGLDQKTAPDDIVEDLTLSHANIRGADYYH